MDHEATRFRLAVPHDIPTIVALVNAAASGDNGTAGWTNEAHLFRGNRTDALEIDELREAPGATFVLSLSASGVIACAYLKVNGPQAYLGLLSVSPRLQGKGVGSKLIAECERIARDELGCDVLRITVITSHRPEVAAFYERRGFVRTGVSKEFERKQAREGRKVDGLKLEWMEKKLQGEQRNVASQRQLLLRDGSVHG